MVELHAGQVAAVPRDVGDDETGRFGPGEHQPNRRAQGSRRMTVARKGSATSVERRTVGTSGHGLLEMRRPRFRRLPVGDVDEQVGVVERLVVDAPVVAAWSIARGELLDERSQLVSLPWFGLQLDDDLDCHVSAPVRTRPPRQSRLPTLMPSVRPPGPRMSDARSLSAASTSSSPAFVSLRPTPPNPGQARVSTRLRTVHFGGRGHRVAPGSALAAGRCRRLREATTHRGTVREGRSAGRQGRDHPPDARGRRSRMVRCVRTHAATHPARDGCGCNRYGWSGREG